MFGVGRVGVGVGVEDGVVADVAGAGADVVGAVDFDEDDDDSVSGSQDPAK